MATPNYIVPTGADPAKIAQFNALYDAGATDPAKYTEATTLARGMGYSDSDIAAYVGQTRGGAGSATGDAGAAATSYLAANPQSSIDSGAKAAADAAAKSAADASAKATADAATKATTDAATKAATDAATKKAADDAKTAAVGALSSKARYTYSTLQGNTNPLSLVETWARLNTPESDIVSAMKAAGLDSQINAVLTAYRAAPSAGNVTANLGAVGRTDLTQYPATTGLVGTAADTSKTTTEGQAAGAKTYAIPIGANAAVVNAFNAAYDSGDYSLAAKTARAAGYADADIVAYVIATRDAQHGTAAANWLAANPNIATVGGAPAGTVGTGTGTVAGQATSAVATATPYSVQPGELIENRIRGLLSDDSLLNQQVRTDALKWGNAHNLLNSTMTQGAATDALIRNALSIAGPDAARMGTVADTNNRTTNTFALDQAGRDTNVSIANMGEAGTNARFNANWQNDFSKAAVQQTYAETTAKNLATAQQALTTINAANATNAASTLATVNAARDAAATKAATDAATALSTARTAEATATATANLKSLVQDNLAKLISDTNTSIINIKGNENLDDATKIAMIHQLVTAAKGSQTAYKNQLAAINFTPADYFNFDTIDVKAGDNVGKSKDSTGSASIVNNYVIEQPTIYGP